ncbi:MAG: hypothetical protein Q8P25_00135 [Candidatus Curtissbacteria bacterium]|nr:hypothetical protein [Candidatus Curtissbacteria bacterium]
MVPLSELCETGDIKAIAEKKGCVITTAQWVRGGVKVVNIIPRSGGPLVLFTSKQDKGEFPESFILDNDLDRFREIFGGAVG